MGTDWPRSREQGCVQREGRERRETAENARGQEQAPRQPRIGLVGEPAREQAHDQRARRVHRERAVRESRALEDARRRR